MSGFVRRERPPSAGHVRTDSRGHVVSTSAAGGSGRNQFAHIAFDAHAAASSGASYAHHTDFAMGGGGGGVAGGGPQAPSFVRTGSYGQAERGGSGGGVKLPSAVSHSPPASSSDSSVSDLRSALAREIEYRRQLEGEVAGMKDTLGMLVAQAQY